MKVGISERQIQTPLGMQMTGYGGRVTGAIGIHDPLKMSALYIESNGVSSMIITCQVLGFDPEFSKKTEERIAKEISIPAQHIILACIHTHAGPASGTLLGCGSADPTWLSQTQNDLIECAKESMEAPFEAKMVLANGTCDIAMNRVAMLHKNKHYKEMIDKEVLVLKFFDVKTDALKVIYINYACHPVTLGNKNHLYSADYPHYTIEKLTDAYESKPAVIFSTGCCGDLDPRYRMSFDMTKKAGLLLAEAVEDSSDIDTYDQVELSSQSIEFPIELDQPYSYDDFLRMKKEAQTNFLQWAEQDYANNYAKLQMAVAQVQWAEKHIEQHENNALLDVIHPTVKVLTIGDVHLVALPFETFHELGCKIKSLFGQGKTLVICYANGVYGYLPYGDLYDLAVYEAQTAFRYYGYIGPVVKKAGDVLFDQLATGIKR